jgi:hypothetical protein
MRYARKYSDFDVSARLLCVGTNLWKGGEMRGNNREGRNYSELSCLSLMAAAKSHVRMCRHLGTGMCKLNLWYTQQSLLFKGLFKGVSL